MWIIFAVLSMLGSATWYVLPKFFPGINPFAPMFWYSCVLIIIAPILTRLTSEKWVDLESLPYGLILAVAGTATTAGLIMAMNAGGKLSVISIIIEISLIIAILFGIFYFKESLNLPQIIGIILSMIGIVIVIGFDKY